MRIACSQSGPLSHITLTSMLNPYNTCLLAAVISTCQSGVNAVRCSDVSQNALQNFNSSGTGWMCCSATTVDCIALSPDLPCDDEHGSYAQCVNLGGVKACSMHEYAGITTADGAPCGTYDGEVSPTKYSSLKGQGTTSLSWSQSAVGQAVLDNWPILGFENYLSLCCTQSTCGIVNVTSININACDSKEHMLKCSGDNQRGICSIWSGDIDSGQYFLINTAAPNPSPDPSSERIIPPPVPSTIPVADHPGTHSDGTSPISAPYSVATSTSISAVSDDHPLSPPTSSSVPLSTSTSVSPSGALSSSSPSETMDHVPVWTIALIAALSCLLLLLLAAFLHARGYCSLRHKRMEAHPYYVQEHMNSSSATLSPSIVSERTFDTPPPQYSADNPLDQKRGTVLGQ